VACPTTIERLAEGQVGQHRNLGQDKGSEDARIEGFMKAEV
jgi:hypothetical protein